jgi:hypothetical protein
MKKISLLIKWPLGFLLVVLMVVSSCKKLDETPLSFVSPDDFYTTPAQVEAVFASAMNSLWDAWSAYGYAMVYFSNDDQLNGGDLNIPDNWASDLWAAHYAAILNLNTAIGSIEQGSLKNVSQDVIDQLIGQAKFLRAYNYFMLVRMFGDLPLLTEAEKDPFHAQIARSSVEDVYQLIIDDFTEAIAKLPSSWPEAQQGRPTMDVAKALLAKAYLTMATYPLNKPENYQKAAELAGEVIQDGRYHLVSDINDVFSVATKYGPEMMWSFNSNYNDMATDPHIWSDIQGWGDESADPIWVDKYPDQPRKYAYIQTEFDGEDYKTLGRLPGIKKYLYDTPDDFDAGRSIVNIPIIRYADVLLIYAEAENMSKGGPTADAVEYLNQVIDRANGYQVNPADPLATTAMSQTAFDTKVIQERNWELCFEYDRWFDLIRKHILKQESNPNIQQNFSEDDYLFPIPENDIRLNPMLTQNPGY